MRFLSDITQYSYSPLELRRCVRGKDFWKYRVPAPRLNGETTLISEEFFDSGFSVKGLVAGTLRENRIFYPDTLYDTLCLRRTDQIVRKALRTTLCNRDDEIRQLMQVLAHESDAKVFRGDVRAFFESVLLSEVIARLESDGFRNNCAIKYIRSLNSHLLERHNYNGLPRGIALSSTLADYVLQEFDRKILNLDSVVYYTRYVDDICIVHFDTPASIQVAIENFLPSLLQLNEAKTKHFTRQGNEILNFLGYAISLGSPQTASIAANKLGKAKKRIILSLRAYLVDRDFSLLIHRLRFLTSAIRMTKLGRRASVCSGFRHVYRLCTEEAIAGQMAELDRFLHGILSSRRFWLGRKLRANLTYTQFVTLHRMSFKLAHSKQLTYRMGKDRVASVQKAWIYE